jgi:hypothetical protein
MAALPEHEVDPGGSWSSRIYEHAAELSPVALKRISGSVKTPG